MGFERFGKEHICVLLITGAIIVVNVWICSQLRRKAHNDENQKNMLKPIISGNIGTRITPDMIYIRIMALLLLATEIQQDMHFLILGQTILYNLPLHLCGIGIFVDLYCAFANKNRSSDAMREISLMLIGPGALSALLFPDWTDMPILSWLSVTGFISHSFLIMIPLMMIKTCSINPRISHIWYYPVFLCMLAAFIYPFDKLTKTNYMFLLAAPSGTPLERLYNVTGKAMYIPGMLIMVVGIVGVLYMILDLIRYIIVKTSSPA
ncbi:MAG: YwaF family protein [Lachnospiraceae bacterium]|nr:YwaF family protein [Lachnospiraceae bacterium]MEE3460558.1 YwaF family protein [Lachnospiraceae bacterium]